MSVLDVWIIHEYKAFTTSVYSKTTFSRVYTHFDSFQLSTYKVGTAHTHSLIDASEYAQAGLNYTLN